MIEHLKKSPNAVRARDESLQLGVVLTHMLNGCLYRNTTKTPYPQLEADVAMHQAEDLMSEHDVDVYDDERYDWSPVGDKQGLFLLGILRRVLDGDMLALAYKAEDMPTLRGLFGQTGIRVVPSKRNPYRVPNRQTQTSSTINHRTEPVPERNLGLADRASGSTSQSREGRPSIARRTRTSASVKRGSTGVPLWEQFKCDLLQKAPSPKGRQHRSFLTVTAIEKVNAPDRLFKSPVLPFTQCRVNHVDGTFWTGIMFDRYFPPTHTTINHSLQNYVQCGHPRAPRALLGLFNQMLWLPQPENDRIWNTRQAGASSAKAVPTGSRGPAPILAVNPLVYKGERWVIRSVRPEEMNPEEEGRQSPVYDVPFEMSSDEEQADREQAARDERIRRREEEEESSE
ncbi:uncharacterized protein B0H18DRAFT_1130027 [Fomitopsis serialis]|uniref:uncharacterized protein n=1 Tax=Fomitopsis serialis TaxID=139415 RepID=UPI002008DFC4|nr:uncharacterized protein B0H18DRAFT_1130027 [Neoantrodia serialis]KAH9910505.1 hypothetical protein B0H18DRAFT_1130027 [Neoantrodia serialis]